MDDREIVDLYWQRDEHAIEATAAKYGAYCMKISQNILSDRADSEEVERVLEGIAAAGFECEAPERKAEEPENAAQDGSVGVIWR